MILDIHVLPDPVLRRKAVPVSTIDGELTAFVRDLVETMYAAPGIGLAAPQAGRLERVVVVDVDVEERGKDLLRLINPTVLEAEGQIIWEEGCLSVPDFVAEVKRAARVLVHAWTPEEREVTLEAEGLLAVALQHEIDHLDGKLFIDRLSRLKRDLYLQRLRRDQRTGRTPQPRTPSLTI